MPDPIMAFIPAYRCARQISRVLKQFDPAMQQRLAEVVVVDNQSPDDTLATAIEGLKSLRHVRVTALRNCDNYGLGGSHKVAFLRTLEKGYAGCLVLHGDDQGSIADIAPLLDAGAHQQYDALLGARFMTGSTLEGYSAFRTFGNHVFNGIYGLAAGKRFYDLGSGLNYFSATRLADEDWRRFANDLTFNYYLSLAMVARDWRMHFFPLTWREDDQVSNVKLFSQARRTLGIAWEFLRDREAFLAANHADRPADFAYPSEEMFTQAPQEGG
ncbi:glycosyltransferase family 2 protein [Magnetofaba australis]|uniref:Putative family 2 glycosyl transferase n=1 Tax=Magnetofaba australis IT-1 TaxID=1434232 RepID=A0A1Y2K6I4_9PROT|nr:glycosyltransferase family 2 protein [Magnetofaba australis]OSM04907.1 putative family 2 glycosyl transferase [Magnetofaba australis IT-1]